MMMTVLSPTPTAPPQKRKLPDDRVCAGQPSYTVPLSSKNTRDLLEE